MTYTGELLGDRIVVFNKEEAKAIYKMGFYGKPLGISKPKSVEDANRPLELSLLEGLYLVNTGVLEVRNRDGVVDRAKLESYAVNLIPRFKPLYFVYEDLKKREFVVRSGVKYGADYAIYTLGPGVEHAPFVISVIDATEKISVNELMSYGRVSHSTRKRLVLAVVNLRMREIKYIMFKWVKI
ncbi:tRNA-intron lyase [Metallosphaera tengchongensis]|uniref:tRNA-intron lyase n=1 Tax=Metallosphaera tengchongensis TaxID=1532350 RepID=A0A6N0NSG8_9CREN|nr:tRNA-intron lyase [Metallosphaera tengchongensis]QKQ99783.1 tRNA-intron lyase [Metallosphaera tengchongensis]